MKDLGIGKAETDDDRRAINPNRDTADIDGNRKADYSGTSIANTNRAKD